MPRGVVVDEHHPVRILGLGRTHQAAHGGPRQVGELLVGAHRRRTPRDEHQPRTGGQPVGAVLVPVDQPGPQECERPGGGGAYPVRHGTARCRFRHREFGEDDLGQAGGRVEQGGQLRRPVDPGPGARRRRHGYGGAALPRQAVHGARARS
ncbi:hypothetical protein GCM10010280_11020 [Streptomyces pilosus]|uniref:Uncharacterized protein n=1 Tax=Streptomyces pilosus TaxID=28893 RepID=A0A918ETN9_9ACTN|nr:hypothetical protein GCM10010280_11020 [Streptomyces pilosus]